MEAGLYRPVSPEPRSGVGWLVDHDGEVKVPFGYTEVKYERSKQEEKNNIKKRITCRFLNWRQCASHFLPSLYGKRLT
jgi:hypothetical protein